MTMWSSFLGISDYMDSRQNYFLFYEFPTMFYGFLNLEIISVKEYKNLRKTPIGH
jgi:hypothetical protein